MTLLRLSRASPAISCPTAARSTCWRRVATTRPARWPRWPSWSARDPHHRRRAATPSRPTGALTGRQPGRRRGCDDARGRDRLRRVEHEQRAHDGRHRRLRSARLAAAHRRGDRRRPAAGHRRRRRLPGPAGAGARGRRLGDVHDPGAVDACPRVARRDDGDHEQPLVRHPQHRAGPHGRRRGRARRPGTCSTCPDPTSTSSSSPRAWAFPPSPCTPPRRPSPPSSGPLPNPAPT